MEIRSNLFVLYNKHEVSAAWRLKTCTLCPYQKVRYQFWSSRPLLSSFLFLYIAGLFLSLSLSLSLPLWSFVFLFSFFHAIPLSLLPLPIPRYSQTLLTDETRFVLNFLDRTFRIAFKFARFATRVSLYSICICMYRLSILINIAERRRTRAIRFLDSAKFPNLLTPTSTATHISVMESTFFSYLLIFRYLAPNNFLA